ncbi:MAG: tyrosine-type recombinase/integrase [Chloroflexi bacterium]|uniref:Tyrosine-type recombinase/integrase n=1 Tax=Candidatus Chlorohelix allophototropha TaxID=3003348 RepID=A0A8T7M073_9CHLR|nr:tyrosine-type recombinase/integrase [Chloroflexota bacterium]WJW67164.1 tyrosine-type recombinase/integrase [Chloroflexota bacterium L227-S17]
MKKPCDSNKIPQEIDPFKTLIMVWLDYCRADALSDRTVLDYSNKVLKFWWWWHDYTRYADKLGSHPRDVTTIEARQFVTYLREPNSNRWGSACSNCSILSPASINSYGNTVKVFFSWLEIQGYIPQTPFNKTVKFYNRKKADRTIKTLDLESVSKILKFLTDENKLTTFAGLRDLATFTLLLDSGIRLGELLSIRVCDLDLKQQKCTVNGKTGKRVAIFSDACRKVLSDYIKHPHLKDLKPDSSLWVTVDLQPLTISGFHSLVRRIRAGTGVKFYAHMLRHTFASFLAQQGVSSWDLKELLGHSSITTTEIYVRNNIERLSIIYRPKSPITLITGGNDSPKVLTKKRKGRPPKGRN